MKRLLALFCAVSLLFSGFPAMAVSAAEDELIVEVADKAEPSLFIVEPKEKELFPSLTQKKQLFLSPGMPQEDQFSDEFMDYLKRHLGNCEKEINIEQFNITISQIEDLYDVIWYETPELFHVSSFSYGGFPGSNIVAYIYPFYYSNGDTPEEYQDCLDKMLSGAEYLLQGVKDNKNLTEMEKALILHDRLVVWTEYDVDWAINAISNIDIFSAYGPLGRGAAVCQGYAMAYMYLLEQVGIESDLCMSSELNHAWNIVYIDGVAYHADVTWDDPVNSSSATYNDDYGRVYHDNFLLSSNGIWSTGHKAYDYNTAPNDTRYDGNNEATWWKDTYTAIQMIDNKLYYMDCYGKVLCANDSRTVYDVVDNWGNNKLSSANGMLLYNTRKEVLLIDPETGAASVIYTPADIQSTDGYIEGIKYEKGKIWLQIDDGNGNSVRQSVEYEEQEKPAADYTYTVNNGKATITGYTGIGGSITIPAKLGGYPVTGIDSGAFEGCDILSSVSIPDDITFIADNAFFYCPNLKEIRVASSNPNYSSDASGVLFNKDKTVLLCAPAGMTGSYVMPSSVKAIADNGFYASGLQSITLNNQLANIGSYAFANCNQLKTIQIPDRVRTIGAYAFMFSGLTEITIPCSVSVISEFAFYNCTGMKEIVLEEGVTEIGESAFAESWRIKTVRIPKSVKIIGLAAFQGCTALEDLYYGADKAQWDTIEIGNGNEYLGYAYFHCTHKYIAEPHLPTCTEVGWTVYTCSCGAFYTEYNTAAALDHSFTNYVKDGDFGCTEEGTETAKCDRCDATHTRTVPAQGHSFTNYVSDGNFSCTEQGTETAKCDRCDATDTRTAVGSGKHTYTKKVTKPTCTAKGYTTYTCACGDTYKGDYVNALGHSYKSGSCTRCKYKPAGVKITTQPVNVAVGNKKTATVTVKATGTGLKYTWYYAKKGAKTYTKATSTTNSYSLKMSSSYNGTKAYCEITDQYGNVVKSNVVTLYKGTPAKIKTQPKSVTVAVGKTGKFSIKASGSSLKYSWYIKTKGAASYTKTSCTSKTYSFKMTDKLDGCQVYCVVKDKYGIEVKSSVVTIKAAPKIKITTQPVGVKLFGKQSAKLTVKATGDGLKYQWYYAKKGSSKFKKLSGKSSSYTVKMSSSMDGRRVYCLITDKYGQTVKTDVVTLTQLNAAKITKQPKNVSAKDGKTAKVTLKATGDGLKYTWYYLLPGTTAYKKATATGNTFSVTMSKAYKNTKVYCVVADQYGNSVKSNTVTLKMK